MKLEDIKIGMKVVPHSKYGDAYGLCWIWQAAKDQKQNYLYVVKIHEESVSLSFKVSDTTGNYYFPSDIEPYQEPTMTITQEQFDNLNDGDVVNNKYNGDLFFQGKIGKISFWVNSDGYSNTLSLADLQNLEYSLVTKPENYKGFPLGQYDDKTVLVRVWNDQRYKYSGIIESVTKDGINIEGSVNTWKNAEILTTTPFQLV